MTEVPPPPWGPPQPESDTEMIMIALISRAGQCRTAATRRRWSGDGYEEIRQQFRAESKRCMDLAEELRTRKLVINPGPRVGGERPVRASSDESQQPRDDPA